MPPASVAGSSPRSPCSPSYVDRVKLALDGKWTSGDVWGGLSSKIVHMAPYTNMPDDVKKLAMDAEAAIVVRANFIRSNARLSIRTGRESNARAAQISPTSRSSA